MTHAARILELLRQRPRTAAELYGDGRCGIVHSRIADLRRRGHVVEKVAVPGKRGAAAVLYRLVVDAERAEREPVSASAPARGLDGVRAAGAVDLTEQLRLVDEAEWLASLGGGV